MVPEVIDRISFRNFPRGVHINRGEYVKVPKVWQNALQELYENKTVASTRVWSPSLSLNEREKNLGHAQTIPLE